MNPSVRRLILVIVIFFLIIFGFIWFWRLINRGDNGPVTPRTVLTDLANTDTDVKYVANGKIVGNEQHQEIHITVSRDRRTIEIIQGYENTIIRTESFDNNESAYKTFLAALHNAGFTRSVRTNNLVIPEGTCPTGQRFWYQIIDGGGNITQSLWSTSCGSVRGSFGGNNNTVQWLFENQIPEYNDRTRKVNL